MPQRVAITGASGLIGSALSAFLSERGDEVLHIVRRPARTSAEITWDPSNRQLEAAALANVDAVVHLAGANVGERRWTPSRKQEIFASRVDGTHTLAAALAEADHPIRLVSQSAVGIYGSDRGDEVLTEKSESGHGFLAEVVRAWEAAAEPARAAGLAVAHPRTGIVLAPGSGAMGPLLRLAQLGLAGPLGSGQQFWPWITLRDTVRALAFLVDRPEITGPVNVVGPAPARQKDIAAELARQLHRPALLPAPGMGVRLYLGEFANDILGSQRVVPERLCESGFAHEHDSLPKAIGWLLAHQ
ncbi:TIGR01777 family oxidoreductase [Knoellia sp. p5-6-4]|uniref:TIGR01777 family oxidoreductase n=1 Tax=unclassified Knoellia TaxID=2618719 RepID=UPI0023DA9672|nr:TIGR01777 family oxidoreductase [Knoellia sp. p5-6-4]MDF2143693.1 TIGR01777 family oxidoreductase [Knoellia sp. p5-6-4]